MMKIIQQKINVGLGEWQNNKIFLFIRKNLLESLQRERQYPEKLLMYV